MKHHFEKLCSILNNIVFNLKPIADVAQFLIKSGLLEDLAKRLPEIIDFMRHTFPAEEPKLFMADVLRYLGISPRTYYRKIRKGKLIPRKWEGPDFFYPSDLETELKESKRRGRI